MALGSLTVTVGNWYVHQKRLQTLVDAAALAGGGVFQGCGQDSTAANASITSEGAPVRGRHDALRRGRTTSRRRRPGKVHVVLNSHSYWKKGDPTNGVGLDNTDVSSARARRSWASRRHALLQRLPRRQGDGQRGADALGLAPVRREPEGEARVEMRQKVLSLIGDDAVRRPRGRTRATSPRSSSTRTRRTGRRTTNAVVGAALLTKTTPSSESGSRRSPSGRARSPAST